MSATAASREERHSRGFGNERVREALVGYLFIAAPMILYGILFFYPIGYALYISRYDWGVLGKIDTVGLGNYRELFHDERFGIAIKNGLKFTLAFTIFSMALGLFVAAVINNAIRFRGFFRSAYYFPSIASSAAITAVALFIFSALPVHQRAGSGATGSGSCGLQRRETCGRLRQRHRRVADGVDGEENWPGRRCDLPDLYVLRHRRGGGTSRRHARLRRCR